MGASAAAQVLPFTRERQAVKDTSATRNVPRTFELSEGEAHGLRLLDSLFESGHFQYRYPGAHE